MNICVLIDRACWCGARTSRVVGAFEVVQPLETSALDGSSIGEASGHFQLIECTGCSVCALHPQPDDQQLEKAYSNAYYGASHRKFLAPIAAVIGVFQTARARRIAKCCPKGGAILDVGCGNGGFLLQMQKRGFRVQGTEWTVSSASRVQAHTGLQVQAGDLLALEFPSQTFDAITLWHVFEHLRKPRETIERIRMLLKPGGRLFMSMPNIESRQAQSFGVQWFHHDPPRHLFAFGPHSATLLLDDAGFRIEQLSTWSLEQNPFGDIQSTLNASGLPRDRLYNSLKGLPSTGLGARVADMMRAITLLPTALVRDVIDSSRGRGATMTIQASLRS